MKYKSEAAFSKALTNELVRAGFDVTRIESHGTVRGIPDMFVQGNGFDVWLELKNGSSDWRPGQLGWCFRYFLAHKRKKCVLTLRSTDEGIVFYSMTAPVKAAIQGNLIRYEDLSPDVLLIILKALTFIEKRSLRESCIQLSDTFNVDYDPDAYWEQEELEQQTYQCDKGRIIVDCIELRKNEP